MGLFLQHKTVDMQWAVWKMEESWIHCLVFCPMPEEFLVTGNAAFYFGPKETGMVVCPCAAIFHVAGR